MTEPTDRPDPTAPAEYLVIVCRRDAVTLRREGDAPPVATPATPAGRLECLALLSGPTPTPETTAGRPPVPEADRRVIASLLQGLCLLVGGGPRPAPAAAGPPERGE